ncbi:N-acetylglucosamine-6-phosphate deacetylase [Ketogulonicigenium vulgare]|uniref:N-acetylglucosamine-6-phosphate deacetylase n=1 Tax=Ketogulonicigenium vulgare (strain WSH-001) TaxID=759362 RepID=F9Y8W0_KETVW|nr:N-acetylglucosamine-6-phosphate deacetylase [Ketogulonicigenium vulgare]ADO41782.1 N-acetylglucosamine-6-phosphate deacetylase [Ketogulonicigenium vulgare Y25]AEM40016.1 N-acetylglucosamine-6-phosphate deacetylase [Ketogulonicigenium vulgare WSH-001]ALJ80220.1 N-acetylglucosamine-6-phosphate deacetylase [Ketogulonicigenium vulgare]ANW33081.1 N-acetylglucosamine-6-phosphate deacetylase [Ketogulonicigenium vulgare]AOZ53713.1 N-acetylglucosamine-6-phosphate deacetylase [Ketogulonicigenium vulg
MTEVSGRILTADGWIEGRVVWADDRISAIIPADVAHDAPLILPGFIDLHCHGGGGADLMEGGDAAAKIAALHARYGTTAMLATTMTDTVPAITRAMADTGAVMGAQAADQAAILGVHLEGPFIDATRLGAQPDEAIPASIALIDTFHALAPIRVVTMAPEADPDGTVTAYLDGKGIRVQIGHSSCDYETAAAAFASGRHGVTHMFNAMTGLHHRAPGIVGAALAHAQHAELIPDLLHVHPGAIRAALRAIPNLYAVTDACAAAGMPDGDYRLGTQPVRRCGNGVRLADGTLAGSCLTLLEAFRNLVSIGLSVEEASARTSTIAADYIGLWDRGRIAVGGVADMVVLGTDDFHLQHVIMRGVMAEGANP